MDTGRAPWVDVSVEAASRVRSRSRSSDDARRHARVTRHHARVSPLAPSPSTRDSFIHSFIHSFARPTLGARDRIRRRIASPSARPPSRARENTATHARVNFYSTRARDRRLARVVASPPPARVRARAPRTHPARIDPSRAHPHPRARDGSTSNRHAPLVLVSSARVTITARDLRRWCVRGATRARCVAFVVVVAPSVIARAAIVECGRARRGRGRGRRARGRGTRSCVVSRRSGRRGTRSWVVIGRGGAVRPSPRPLDRIDRSVGRSNRSVGRSVGRGVDGWNGMDA